MLLSWDLATHHSPDTVLLFHFFLQLLEAGFHALVERPQGLSDFVSMNPDPLSQKWNLEKKEKERKTKSQVGGPDLGEQSRLSNTRQEEVTAGWLHLLLFPNQSDWLNSSAGRSPSTPRERNV